MAGTIILFATTITISFLGGVALLLPLSCSAAGGTVIAVLAAMAGGSLGVVTMAVVAAGARADADRGR
jgi:hypothetical protein